ANGGFTRFGDDVGHLRRRVRPMRMFLRPILLVASLILAAPTLAEPLFEGRRVSVGAEDAQQFIQSQFPQRHDALGGLLQLALAQPRLLLPPGQRLHLELDLAGATAGGTPAPLGRVLLSSALRYDAAARAFFLEPPAVESFRPARPELALDGRTRGLLNAWLADYARSEPVYRLEPAMAALLGGMEVESAGVADGRLYVLFDRDPVTGMAAP